MEELECPVCNEKIQAEVWTDGACPQCGNYYTWDEQCTADYSDCWTTLCWDKYE
jgi:predicted RNA-binding Zn-ribbon protein involved in translation (DUF1610 family)